MRWSVPLLAVSALLVTASVDAKTKSKKKQPKPREVMTGDPLPVKPVKDAACHDKGAIRFIGAEPSTPLAMVSKGKIREPGQACCAQWARKGARYQTLDAHGQIVGEATITGGEGYDVTQCYELSFTKLKGDPGVGLYVDPEYVAPKSAAWTPTDAEKSALAKAISGLEHAMVPNASYPCDSKVAPLPLEKRAIYFKAPRPLEDEEGKIGRWVVVGGPMLVIARLQKDGRWIARHVDAFGTNTCLTRAYQPRAVFDMNGDGVPEIVVHDDYGDAFGDFVLGLDLLGDEGKWREVSNAVHGATA